MTGSNFSPASSNFFFSRAAAQSNSRGAAPWNEKIDCFSSPTANTVRITPSRAPAPEVNSEMICATMSHCRGLVSCASSISTWSTPRSSL